MASRDHFGNFVRKGRELGSTRSVVRSTRELLRSVPQETQAATETIIGTEVKLPKWAESQPDAKIRAWQRAGLTRLGVTTNIS
jgi:hypothetical protein